ncbi:MAG: nuclear transport factor 2 family protein [Anaerolineae bacterium]|nr:nuclear transport factor 2 family protein [Anaerolineae bacterium]
MAIHNTDEAAVRAVALDYIEGWFEGDAERMARCLHPKLAKRSIRYDAEAGETRFYHITRDDMIAFTKEGGGKDIPRDKLYYNVDILDSGKDMAVVRVESFGYLDHLHVAKIEGRWHIVNVLYTKTPTT